MSAPASRRPADAPGPTVASPAGWRLAAWLVAAQGVVAIGAAVYYGLQAEADDAVVAAWGAAAIGVALGVLLVAVIARGLARGRRGSVAPSVLTQLIALGMAYNMAQEGWLAFAGVLAGSAVVVLGLVGAGLRDVAPESDDG